MTTRVHYIDPETDIANKKVEFRLHGQAYLNNLKVLVSTHGAGGAKANDLAGLYGAIKHIRLLSKGVEVDSLRFANYYMAFKNMSKTNERNSSMRGQLNKASMGFQMTNKLQFEDRNILAIGTVASSDNPHAGVIYLREALPILNNVDILNTAIFPELKIVIEYNTEEDLKKMASANATTSAPAILIAEEVLDAEAIAQSAKISGVNWMAIEQDQIVLPAVSHGVVAGTTQSLKRKINGFDGKHVSRVVMFKHLFPLDKNVTAGTSVAWGAYSSYVQNDEKINFNLNGRMMFAGAGLEEQGEKMMLLADTWGPMNLIPYGAQTSVGSDVGRGVDSLHNYGTPSRAGTDANPRTSEKVGAQDVVGFAVRDRVNTLELDYTRVGLADTDDPKRQNESLLIRFFAEVRKQITFSKNGVRVDYA